MTQIPHWTVILWAVTRLKLRPDEEGSGYSVEGTEPPAHQRQALRAATHRPGFPWGGAASSNGEESGGTCETKWSGGGRRRALPFCQESDLGDCSLGHSRVRFQSQAAQDACCGENLTVFKVNPTCLHSMYAFLLKWKKYRNKQNSESCKTFSWNLLPRVSLNWINSVIRVLFYYYRSIAIFSLLHSSFIEYFSVFPQHTFIYIEQH